MRVECAEHERDLGALSSAWVERWCTYEQPRTTRGSPRTRGVPIVRGVPRAERDNGCGHLSILVEAALASDLHQRTAEDTAGNHLLGLIEGRGQIGHEGLQRVNHNPRGVVTQTSRQHLKTVHQRLKAWCLWHGVD